MNDYPAALDLNDEGDERPAGPTPWVIATLAGLVYLTCVGLAFYAWQG